VHPARTKGATPMREVVMSGNTSTLRASGGRAGMGSSAVCDECWLVTWTDNGASVGCTLTSWDVGAK
jgi:hypothetical protein